MPHPELPSSLGDAFSVVSARVAGVSRSRLRSRDLQPTFYGARARSSPQHVGDARTYPLSPQILRVHERARHYAPLMMRDAFYSHLTAAVLWDVPLPDRLFGRPGEPVVPPAFDPEIVEVSVLWPHRAPRGSGVRGHAVRPNMAHAMLHPASGLQVATPATTWVMLAGRMPHPYDLVAAAEHFVRVSRAPVHAPGERMSPPLATIAQLTAALEAGRRRGAAQLRQALGRVRTGSHSRTETWTRLSIIDAGLPEPELDHDVVDDRGTFLARVDMAYPLWRIAIEYEGTHHGSVAQWESDIDRYARLEDAGWKVIRVTRRMLFRAPRMLHQRVGAAIVERSR